MSPIIIIGGGPAGLAAGMYLSRVGFKTLLLEADKLGGQSRLIEKIENYPGFPKGVSGKALMRRFVQQAKRWGLKTVKTQALRVLKNNGCFAVRTPAGVFKSRALIFSGGSSFKKLGLLNEDKFFGRGIYHHAFDRAAQFQGQSVVVVGGGDAALHQALFLARWAKRVWIIHRGNRFRAMGLLREKLEQCSKIALQRNAVVEKILGRGKFQGIEIRGIKTGVKKILNAQALFVLIGKEPDLKLIENVKAARGVFVAGDVSNGQFRQVAIASGDGVRAAMECEKYLRGKGH